MKFLHAADLHLDTPFQGLTGVPAALRAQLIAAPLAALTRLVDLAIAEQVDFVLLVGDLFDQQAQSVATQAGLMAALERLNTAQIPVVLSFGNHDYQPAGSQWHFPANVHAFGPSVKTVTLTTADQTQVAISGFSYDQRWVTTPKIADYPTKLPTVDYHIGMLHGQLGTAGDHYAPFSVGELLAKHYDYWALGHIHQRQTLNAMPPVVYPGNLQGRYRDETGQKGCLIVESQADQTLRPVFHTLAPIIWTTWTPKLQGTLDRPTLLKQLVDQFPTTSENGTELVLISLPATVELSTTAMLALTQGALLTQLQGQLTTTACWPVDLQLAADKSQPALGGLDQAVWQQAGKQVVTTEQIAALADHLLAEPFLNQALLEDLTPAQWQQRVLGLLQEQYHLTTEGGSADGD